MELIVSSETSANKTQTPGIYPKENILHLEHGENLKSRIKSLFILLKKAQAIVQKTSRRNVMSTGLIFSSFLFDGRHGWKNHSHLKRTALK
jgi:hypothetical protein